MATSCAAIGSRGRGSWHRVRSVVPCRSLHCRPPGSMVSSSRPTRPRRRSAGFTFRRRTVFHGGVPWVFLAVSIVGALLVVNVYAPARREPLTVVSFVLGWVLGEVPIQTCVVWVALAVLLAAVGALRTWPGWVGLAIAVGSWVGLAGLADPGCLLYTSDAAD